jgi:hypothetical protein
VASEFFERSLQVCQDFLQTAVIIDDRFNFQPQTIPEVLASVPERNRNPQIIRAEGKNADNKGGALNARSLINCFAVHGIICGALNFNEYGEDSIAFLKTAKRADIAIIDWEMEEEKTGNNALSLISELLQDDLLSPQRFRLISIYTGTDDLSSISEAIQNHIQKIHSVQLDVQDQGLRLRYHSITITIFAKDEHGIPDHFKEYVVNEQALPERLISCFSQSMNGLLPNTALVALTALRNNSHKLLGQFQSRLDAAYLSHRIMSNPPEDAEKQLVQLIVSHISGILEEHNVSDQANSSASESWLNAQCNSGTQFRNRIHIKKDNEHAKDQLLRLLKSGLTNASLNKGNKSFYKKVSKLKHETTKSVLSELTAIFTDNPDNAEILDRDLSYMLSCKTFYKSPIRKLEPGTILKCKQENSTESYLICIQPACDCIRIPRKGRKFLFLPLSLCNDRFDICIPKEGLNTLNLKVEDKAYSIATLHFAPPKASEPIFAVKQENQWVFFDTNEPPASYEWIATLKEEFALRLAHNYGKNVSRVGITESEWQRRWAK